MLHSDSINYKQAAVLHPTYQYVQQYPQEGRGTYAVSNGQVTNSTFQLIPNVFNLSKSKLCFTVAVPAQGAGNFTWFNVNGLKQINRITVQPQGGPVICDINDVDRYLDVVTRRSFAFADVQTWDSATTYPLAGTGTSFNESLIPSNFTTSTAVRLDNTSMTKPGQESEYVSGGAANSSTYMDFKISFDKLVDTILAVDHDLYWKGNNLTVTIYWNQVSKYSWISTNISNPAIGAVALPVAGAAISNPYILLAIEQNKTLVEEIMTKCLSPTGLSIRTPYVTQSAIPVTAGGNNLQVYYNSGQGSHIKKIYWAPYLTTPLTPNLYYDKNNLASAKITQYQTQINGVAVQQYPYVPINGDEFLEQRQLIRGSDILSFNEHLYNWCHIEDFTEHSMGFLKTLFPEIPDDNLIDGSPLLNAQMQYNINSTSVVNLTNLLFTVFLRTLVISGERIDLV